jgi:hypothetical protein
LCLLGDDDQRTGIERNAGEDEVEQDPRLRIKFAAFGEGLAGAFEVLDRAVDNHPGEDDQRADQDELHGAHGRSDALGHALHEAASAGIGRRVLAALLVVLVVAQGSFMTGFRCWSVAAIELPLGSVDKC